VVAGYYDAQPYTNFEAAVVPYALVMPERVDAKTFLPATRSMLLEKEVWQRVGKFDEQLADNEDFAFAQKLKKMKIPIAFASQAKVTWRPRSSLVSFVRMIYRFAKGDAFAGLWRPKVFLIFVRYLVGSGVLLFLLFQRKYTWALNILLVTLVLYSYWALRKNKVYAKKGWYWLPILQITSDIAVMVGTTVGIAKRIFAHS